LDQRFALPFAQCYFGYSDETLAQVAGRRGKEQFNNVQPMNDGSRTMPLSGIAIMWTGWKNLNPY